LRILVALAIWIALANVGIAQTDGGGLAGLDDNLLSVAPAEPLPVHTGIQITQITGVDQKAENFSVVARLRMEWQNPKMTYQPGDFRGDVRALDSEDFLAFARENQVLVPVATYENLQARSFDKESLIVWTPEGDALHVSETILTLQAPDFDFRQYPFDEQKFFVRLIMTSPIAFFRFEALDDFSGLGDTLGEEEWVVSDVWTEIDEATGIAGWQSSRFSLGFSAKRHLIYYWTRIFIPLLLLVSVSWANLFLQEYRRRIDIASANLLAFIAFSFTVSGALPRLGYVTFLDALLLAMFVLSALTVAYNVMLRRMAIADQEDWAYAIDWHVTIWAFPLIYIATVFAIWMQFFT
jgi:hypothetical protein